jgi:hypothetical protein
MVNWTMIPNLTAVFEELAGRVFPTLPPRDRLFFFDLADPEKRSAADLSLVLHTIARFQSFGRVTLGLNLKEAQQVFAVLGGSAETEDERGLRSLARRSGRNSASPPWSSIPPSPPCAPPRTTRGGCPDRTPRSR